MRKLVATCVFVLLFAPHAGPQTVQVNPQSRTIEITADDSVQVEADIVQVTLGYHNYGRTQDATYDENLRVSSQILKAWKDAGLPDKEIETRALNLSRVSEEELKDMSEAERKDRQYEAKQSFSIRSPAATAQKLVDLAITAGANEVEDPIWMLSEPAAAEAKAYAAAVEKAHTIAGSIAKSFGARVGPLLYASNFNRAEGLVFHGGLTVSASLAPSAAVPRPRPLKLLPQKVEKSATVRAIFALE